MFVRGKKPQGFVLKKPKESQTANKPITKPKALGGFSDDEQQVKELPQPTNGTPTEQTFSQPQPAQPVQSKKKDEFKLLSSEALDGMLNIEHQKKLVDEITQPGGIRVRPNESLLADFSKAAKTLQASIVGSLLISKLQLDVAYAMKAVTQYLIQKALYTMEYLVKKVDKYKVFFNRHLEYIRQLPTPAQFEDKYRDVRQEFLASLTGTEKNQKVQSNEPMQFLDPGYSTKPNSMFSNSATKTKQKEEKKTGAKKFLGPQQLKKQQRVEQQAAIDIMNEATSHKAVEQPPKIDIFNLEGLKLDQKPAYTPPTSTNTQQTQPTFSLYNQQPIQVPIIPSTMPNQYPPQMYQGYNMYNMGMPMVNPGFPIPPTAYPQYPMNGMLYPTSANLKP